MFIVQGIFFLLALIVYTPIVLISGGAFRKVIQHSFLGESGSLLLASIPGHIRTHLKNLTQSYAQPLSFIMLSAISYLIIFKIIPMQVLFILGLVFAFMGIFIMPKLLETLNKYHVSRIVNFQKLQEVEIKAVVDSSYALANKQAQKHYLTLLMVTTQRPPAILAKAIIYALGEIKHEKSIKVMAKIYKRSEREDIRVSIIEAFSKMKFKDSYDFIKESYFKQIMGEEGEILKSLCKTLAQSPCHDELLNESLNLLHGKDSNNQVVFNIITCLEYFNLKKHATEIKRLISDLDYTSSISIKAKSHYTHYLIDMQNKEIKNFISNELKNNNDLDNQKLFVQIAGKMKLKKSIEEMDVSIDDDLYFSYVTSKIKLKFKNATKDLLSYLSSLSQENLVMAQRSIYEQLNLEERYRLYETLLGHFGVSFISRFIHTMEETGKDFDNEIDLIKKEALRLKIHLIAVTRDYKEY